MLRPYARVPSLRQFPNCRGRYHLPILNVTFD
jgi:hypothetical protein